MMKGVAKLKMGNTVSNGMKMMLYTASESR
jgi:hypothetical protein